MRPFPLLSLLLVLAPGCDDSPGEGFPPEPCDQPLPPSDDDGQPWPTYSAADGALADCASAEGFSERRRGSCSDGKRFLERNGGFSGDTSFFEGDALVGLIRWTDVVAFCDDYRFGDVDCEEVDVEALSCP